LELGLPQSVRFVKNGEGGRWWKAAKASGQVHLGWSRVPAELLLTADLAAIDRLGPEVFGDTQRVATRDRNALRVLLDRPSQHLWVTFQDGYMWWCTVHDQADVNPTGESRQQGHFWLNCAKAWSNHSVGGQLLATADLPGIATTTAGFRGTVCEPAGWEAIRRIILDEVDPQVVAANKAREAYEAAVKALVTRLHDKDFEVLVDLILSRTGWARVAKLGGVTEGIDVEVENAASQEIAFVQVKSTAGQPVLDDYVRRFRERRERYARMIFAVHSVKGKLTVPADEPIQVWDGNHIAQLVVALGLGNWVGRRL
jgi:hypothetical protein